MARSPFMDIDSEKMGEFASASFEAFMKQPRVAEGVGRVMQRTAATLAHETFGQLREKLDTDKLAELINTIQVLYKISFRGQFVEVYDVLRASVVRSIEEQLEPKDPLAELRLSLRGRLGDRDPFARSSRFDDFDDVNSKREDFSDALRKGLKEPSVKAAAQTPEERQKGAENLRKFSELLEKLLTRFEAHVDSELSVMVRDVMKEYNAYSNQISNLSDANEIAELAHQTVMPMYDKYKDAWKPAVLRQLEYLPSGEQAVALLDRLAKVPPIDAAKTVHALVTKATDAVQPYTASYFDRPKEAERHVPQLAAKAPAP